MIPFRNRGWVLLHKVELLIPPTARGLDTHRPNLAPSFTSSDNHAPPSISVKADDISIIQSMETFDSDHGDKGNVTKDNADTQSIRTPLITKRKHSAIKDTTPFAEDGDRKSLKSTEAASSSASLALSIQSSAPFNHQLHSIIGSICIVGSIRFISSICFVSSTCSISIICS